MKKWTGKTRGGTFGNWFFVQLICRVGIRAAYVFLAFVVVYFVIFAPKSTRTIWRYARTKQKFGRIRSAWLVVRNYYCFGQTLIDKVAVLNGKKDEYSFNFAHYDEFLDILNSNQGVVIIGAHVGNWEIGAPFFEDYGKKINVVMYDAEYQKIKDIIENGGTSKNYKIIPVNADNLAHVFRITEALSACEYVCFQGDRFVNEDKLLSARFLGEMANFPAGPFLLASRMKKPVVFYFSMRGKGRMYDFSFHLAKSAERKADRKPEQQLLEQYVSVLENILQKHPEQWFNYYDFWEELQSK